MLSYSTVLPPGGRFDEEVLHAKEARSADCRPCADAQQSRRAGCSSLGQGGVRLFGGHGVGLGLDQGYNLGRPGCRRGAEPVRMSPEDRLVLPDQPALQPGLRAFVPVELHHSVAHEWDVVHRLHGWVVAA